MEHILKLLIVVLLVGGFSNRSLGQAPPKPKKYALLVGIDLYTDVKQLVGCLKDVDNVKEVLNKKAGFPLENLEALKNQQATRDGILNSLKAKQSSARSGDLFVFYFSGHGTLFPDRFSEDKDEMNNISPPGLTAGKYDSALCPVDTNSASHGNKPWENLILDDELFSLFSGFTKAGCMVVFIADSCHSGTIAKGVGVEAKYVSPEKAIKTQMTNIVPATLGRVTSEQDKQVNARGMYLTLSSSKDTQTSGATQNGSLFTKHVVKAINEKANQSYRELYAAIKNGVMQESSQSQNPQLDTRFYTGSVETRILTMPNISAAPPVSNLPLTVKFLVTNRSEKAIHRANISILTTQGNVQALGRTDNKGRFKLNTPLSPGTYQIKVQRNGYVHVNARAEVFETALNRGEVTFWIRMRK